MNCYQQRKEKGLCGSCGNIPDRPGKVTCSGCAKKGRLKRLKAVQDGLCATCFKRPLAIGRSQVLCERCLDRYNVRQQQKEDRQNQYVTKLTKLKQQAAEKLGNSCVWCGESILHLLDFDHIDNNGAKHRSDSSTAGSGRTNGPTIWREVRDGRCKFRLQLLCKNCHWLKTAWRRSHENGTFVKSPGAKVVKKVWGVELWLENSKDYCAKRLILNPGFQCSLHRHLLKRETFAIIRGIVYLQLGNEVRKMIPGEFVTIEPGIYHRFWTFTPIGAEIFETSTQHFDEDSYRLEPSGPKGTQEFESNLPLKTRLTFV